MKIAEVREKFPMYADMPDGELVRGLHKKFYADIPYSNFLKKIDFAEAPIDPTQDMGGMQKFNAGAGKAFADIGRGAAQLVGAGPDADATRENRRLDAPLMKTGAGTAGNVAGYVSALAPAMLLPGAAAVPAAGALGAATGALQPTEGTGERLGNMAVGGALGAGTQAVAQYPAQILEALKKPFTGSKALVEPLYEKGREQIVSRTLNKATSGSAPAVQARLMRGQELVPGSKPTAAELGESGGLAAMQRTAAATNPEAYATRAAQQNEARVSSLTDLAGTHGARGSIEANRDAIAKELYKKAREQGIDPVAAKSLKPQIKNLMERVPSGVKDKATELARLNGEKLGKEGSIEGLHWMKLAVDDLLSSGKQTGIGSQTERGLVQYKNDLLTVIDDLSPAYAKARTTYQTMSKPVNQMDIAQAISDKATNPLTGQLQPQAYARALSDDMAAKATGFNKATLENTLEPSQLASLNAIKSDLARSVQARDLGRGPGSDTVQKMSMGNIAQQSGLPMSATRLPGVGRAGNWIYDSADERMREMLAEALLNPKKTAQLMSMTQGNRALGAPPKQVTDQAGALARALLTPTAMSSRNQ